MNVHMYARMVREVTGKMELHGLYSVALAGVLSSKRSRA